MVHKLIQRNFIVIWIIVLLSLVLVLTLLLTGCSRGTTVISAKEIPNKTAEAEKPVPAQPNAVVNTTKNISAEKKPAAPAAADSSSKKDLKLVNILASTIYPQPNELFDVTANVQNPGQEKIDSFEYLINIMKGGALEKTQRGEGGELPAGGKIKIKNEFSLSSKGEYVIEVILDPGNKVKEFNEANNNNTFTINVVAPSNTTTHANEVAAPVSSGACTDTDGGLIYTAKGKCTDQGAYSAGFNDFCSSSTELVEMYCKNGVCAQTNHYCSCSEGACK